MMKHVDVYKYNSLSFALLLRTLTCEEQRTAWLLALIAARSDQAWSAALIQEKPNVVTTPGTPFSAN
ncbi:uncharacterized protein ARMOST_00439 [Armillaria ostoyae]|uniref:Uncharacterized protein n=1 Tax=Armillaria ostoyae TaxID=47428 RepID=A0A284QL55_ARMOS|nr:uncharacterized protein ARMOST_00439 [Armillaria ostoyae]